MEAAVSTAICQLKAKDSEIKDYTPCLGNFSKDFTINNMKKITKLKERVNFFLFIWILLMLMIF